MMKRLLFFLLLLPNFPFTAVAVPPPCSVSATLSSTNITCRGAGDGTITISSPTGGSGTYQYSINGGTSWLNSGSFTGLGVSVHSVQIRDKNNTACSAILNAALSITQPAVLNAAVVATNVTCYGSNDGTITFNSATGGNGSYNYSTDNGLNWQSGSSFTGLAPNIYDVKIQDAACSSVITSLGTKTINQPTAAVSATVAKTDITCHGAADGTITVTGLGGYGTYQYSMNGGSTWLNNGGIFTGLGVSTHDIQVRDKANPLCFYDYGNVSIIQPGLLTGTINHTDITCFGNIDGTITINSAGGGSGNYEYRVDGGTWQISNSFSALAGGIHTVEIQDMTTTCTNSLFSPTISEPSGALAATVNYTDVTCFGANDGSITISSPSGGYGTYQYSKDGGINWLNNGGSFSGLANGTFNVQIRDKAHTGCYTVLNSALILTRPPKLNATVSSTNITCFGANDGTITISSPSGGPSSIPPGVGTYLYSIDGGITYTNNTGIFDNLPPSSATLSYDVWIQDATDANCTVELGPLTITEPAEISATLASANVSCYGASDGTITISSPSGGYGTYQYSKDAGTNWLNNGGSFSGLANGTFNVQIRDKAHTGCYTVLNSALIITRPPKLNATVVSTNVTCNGTNDGTITISSPSGGPSSLLPGGGSYKYSIDGGNTYTNSTGIFNSLPPSSPTLSYDVWIQDATDANCTVELGPLTITETASINATVNSTEVTCFGAVDGTITISSPSGGSGTYQYSKNGGTNWLNNGGSFSGLAYGTYNVQIRDKAHTGCYTVLNSALIITRPPKLSATVTPTNVTCNGANDGKITITSPSGGPSSLPSGVGSYKYSIDGGQTYSNTTGIFNSLSPSSSLSPIVSYDVWIQDASDPDCTVDLGFQTITQPDAPDAPSASATAQPSCSVSTGTITVSSTTTGLHFSIDGSAYTNTSGVFTDVVAGDYYVTARNSDNCVSAQSGKVTINAQPDAPDAPSASATAQPSCSVSTGTITVSSTTTGLHFSIDGSAYSNTSGVFTDVVAGDYYVTARNSDNCVSAQSGKVTINAQPDAPDAPTASATAQPSCSVSTGTITVSSTTTGLHFSIDGSAYSNTSGVFTGVSAGDYYVTARNSDNCVSAQSGKVTINAQPTICTPTTQASNIVFSVVQSAQFTASWTNGNGTSRAVFIKQDNAGTTTPVDGTNYTSNTAFGIGDQITPGWYCVYNGTGSTVTVTGLTAGADYIIQVFEYNGTTGTEKYNTTTAADNPNNTITTTGCTNPTSGGTIAASQTICSGTTPAAFTSIAAASGQTGTLEYKWQWSTTSATANNFADIASSNSATNAPGSLIATTWYKRLARVNCILNWTGAAESNVIEITVNPLPAPFNVTGGTGVAVGLDGSQIGVNYQLVNGTTNTGSPVPGTGSAISFGIQSAVGTYTIVATNTTIYCTKTMTGSAIVTSGTSVYTVTGGGSFCANASGVLVGLSGSKRGTLYQLRLNDHGIGNVVIGTGSAINFGLKTVPGTYTVAAVTILPLTSVPMTGSAIITVNPLPRAPGAITGTTAICVGNTSTLNESTTSGVWSSSNTAIVAVSDVGVVTGLLPGTVTIRYTVTNGSGCSNSASTTVTVSSSVSQPSNFNLSTSSVRQGQRNVVYAVPAVTGVVYSWSYSGLGATISGTTNLVFISFSNIATTGILSVYASNGCGLSIPRTMSITVVRNRLKMDTISATSPTGILENPNLKNELKIFPNPTQGSATFEFRINENARVKLDVYSITGQRIIQIYNGDVQAGVTQTVLFDQTLPTGLYPCVLSWNGKIITLKLAVTQ